MTVRVRIAPSPTGYLHIGTARTAIYNYLFARQRGGKLILRIEDTERERSEPRYTRSILEGFAWLGISFDEGPVYQSDRLGRYREVIEKLLAGGHAYYDYTSEAELEALRDEQRAAGLAPRYDNRHRDLSAEERAAFAREGRLPVIRFKIEASREVRWNDLVRGELSWSSADLGGDMVIARADGMPLYNLAVVIDDIDMAITHVIRGEDHIGNTPKQILLYEALEAAVPAFGHVPLIFSPEGRKLSKREGATAVIDFERMGYLSEAIVNYLALMSWTPADGQELFSLDRAAESFDIGRISHSPARFDWNKLTWMNGQYLNALSARELTERATPFLLASGFTLRPQDGPWLERVVPLTGRGLGRLSEIGNASRYLFAEAVSFEAEALGILRQSGIAAILTGFQQAVASLDGQLRQHFEAHFAQIAAPVETDEALFERLFFEQAPLRTVLSREASDEQLEAVGALVGDLHRQAEAALPQLLPALAKELGLKKGALMRPVRCALTGSAHGPDLVESIVLLHRRNRIRGRLEQALALVSAPAVVP